MSDPFTPLFCFSPCSCSLSPSLRRWHADEKDHRANGILLRQPFRSDANRYGARCDNTAIPSVKLQLFLQERKALVPKHRVDGFGIMPISLFPSCNEAPFHLSPLVDVSCLERRVHRRHRRGGLSDSLPALVDGIGGGGFNLRRWILASSSMRASKAAFSRSSPEAHSDTPGRRIAIVASAMYN